MNEHNLRALLAIAVMVAFPDAGMTHASTLVQAGGPAPPTPASSPSATGAGAEAESQHRYRVECRAEAPPITYCDWNDSHGRPRLLRQLGRKPCIRNTTWGYNNRGIWVRDRCAGLFVPE